MKSHLRCLLNAQRCLGDTSNLTGEPDFAEHCRRGGNDAIAHAGRDRREHAQIRRRLVDGHPARDVDEHIVSGEVEAGALLEHGEKQ